MVNSRVAALQRLQPLTELQEFLNFVSDEKNYCTPAAADRLVSLWNDRSPHHLTDPVPIWDDVITNR